MLLCIVEDAKRTGGSLQHKRLIWALWIDEHIWKILVFRKTCWFSFHHEGSLLDCKASVEDCGSCHEPLSLSLLELRTDSRIFNCSIQAGSLTMKEGSLRSLSGLNLFCSSLILITICSSFVFMFVRGGRWTFSTAAVRDVKTMKSIKSLYLYFLLWDETKKERHWKSFVVVEDRKSSIQYIISRRESITKQA